MNWFWSLILPAGVQAGLVAIGLICYFVSMAVPNTTLGSICAIIATLSGATALIGTVKKEAGKIEQGATALEEEKSKPPQPERPAGGVEGEPLPPVFPPGTEAGPDHSPYDPRNP